MADTLPKTRVFYRLTDGRVLSWKALGFAETVSPKIQAKLNRTPLTRSQVMSRENLDPRTYGFITVYATAVAERTSRPLRVVEAVLAPPDGAKTSASFTPPDAPHASNVWVGKLVGIPVGNQVIAATSIDVSLDTDLTSGTKIDGRTARILVEVPDPEPVGAASGRGDLALVIVERAVEVIKQHVKVPWITMTTQGGVPNIVEHPQKVKVDSIAAIRPWGSCIGILPIDNTVNARFSTRTMPGLLSISSVSDNHFSSSQSGRDGTIRLATVTKTEDVAGADGSIQRKPVTRKWLSWRPPESTDFGLPVDVSAATGGAECEFALTCTFSAPDGADGTFPKLVKITVRVNADLFPAAEGAETVVVQTTFNKTPDGRPVLGKTAVSPALDLTTLPAWSLIQGHPDEPRKGDPIPNSKEVRLAGVDDQGLCPWHEVARPIFPGRTYPTAVFERWFAVPAPPDALSDQILQKESAVDDHEFDVWFVPVPTAELGAYLRQIGLIRPYSTEPTSPDSKVYPYQEGTPQSLDTDPATLMPDKVLAVLDKYINSIGIPFFPAPVDGIPWYRDPSQIYYFFAIRTEDMGDALTNDKNRFTGQSRFDDGPLDPPDKVVQFPVATHLSGTQATPIRVADDIDPATGARVVVSDTPPGLTQSLLFIYPRRFKPAKSAGPDDALQALGASCGDQSKDPMAQADLLAQSRENS